MGTVSVPFFLSVGKNDLKMYDSEDFRFKHKSVHSGDLGARGFGGSWAWIMAIGPFRGPMGLDSVHFGGSWAWIRAI